MGDDGILFGAAAATTTIRRRRLPRDRDNELGPRSVRLPDHDIRSEHQLVQALRDGVYHLDGRFTGDYWAMPPRGHPTRRELIGARDLAEFAERLAEAEGLYDL